MCLWLLVGGAIFELGGIALVAWDVIDGMRARRELSRGDVLVQAPPAEATVSVFPPTLSGADPPRILSPEERLDRLEGEMRATQRKLEAIEEQATRDHRERREQVAAWVAEARREAWTVGQELRPLIGEIFAGSLRRRALSVLLFCPGRYRTDHRQRCGPVGDELADVERQRVAVPPRMPAEGFDYHVAFLSDGQLVVSEVGDSQEQLEAFGKRLGPLWLTLP